MANGLLLLMRATVLLFISTTMANLDQIPANIVVILQVADTRFFEQYQRFVSTIKYFAKTQGFEYQQVIVPHEHDQEKCVYTSKVLAIEAVLLTLPSSSWLWYLDTDVAFTGATDSSDVLGDFLDKANISTSKCHFIAQDSPEQINTGCFLIRNTKLGRTMMGMWRDKQERYQPCRKLTSADQVTLQDSVLENLLPDYAAANEPCLQCGGPQCLNCCMPTSACKAIVDCLQVNCTAPPPAAPWDWSRGWPNTVLSDGCYGRWMADHGFPVDHRITSEICLLPSNVRFNVHDWEPTQGGILYEEGDIFFVPHGFYALWKSFSRDVILRRLRLVTQGYVIWRLVDFNRSASRHTIW